jgi:hypothetical protein
MRLCRHSDIIVHRKAYVTELPLLSSTIADGLRVDLSVYR